MKLGVDVARVEMLDQIERAARFELGLLGELVFRARHLRTCTERRDRELAHRDAMIVGRELLAERMRERRHEPHLVDVRLEHVERDQLVRDMRRIEAAAEQTNASHRYK